MVWSTAVFVVGTLLIKRVALTSIDYEPIQITVNENFNSQSSSPDSLPGRSGILHQGANFYFKPQINIPPAHIEALTSLVQQDRSPKRVIETEKLIEIIKSLPTIFGVKDEKREDILKLLSSLSVPVAIKDEIPLLMQKIVPVVEAVKCEEPTVFKEATDIILPNVPVVIPEAPTLPPLEIEEIVPVVEEVKLEQPVVIEESVGLLSPVAEIEVIVPEEPNLLVEEEIMPIAEEIEIIQPAVVKAEIGGVIPEAPTLPPLLIEEIEPVVEELNPVILEQDVISSVAEISDVILETPTSPPTEELVSVCEDVEPVELVKLEKPVDVWSLIEEIDEIISETSPSIEEVGFEEPIIVEETVGAESATTKIVEIIPEAPTLPPLQIEDFVPVEEIEPIILEKNVGVLSPNIEMEQIVPDAPTLPPASIENVGLVVEDVLLEEPDILEELLKLFPEIDREVPEASALTIEKIEPKEPMILEEYADVVASNPEIDIIVPETIILDEHIPVGEEVVFDSYLGLKEPVHYLMNAPEPLIIPEAPEVYIVEEPVDLSESTIITEPVLESDTAEYIIPEKCHPIIVEEAKEDVIMSDFVEPLPILEDTKLDFNKDPSVTNSTDTQTTEVKRTYVPEPRYNQEVFKYGPIISQLSILKPENPLISKSKSLKNALVKGHPYRFRTYPYPNLSLKKQSEHSDKILLPTLYAHDIVKNRIAPKKSFKKASTNPF